MNVSHTRRQFIRRAAAGTWGLVLLPGLANGCKSSSPERADAEAWGRVPDILARIQAPRFPDRDFVVTEYGAVEGGAAVATEAFRRSVEACHAAGGGRVVVPAGVYLTGPIHLRSNVNLHVAEGATLRFSTTPADYLPAVYTRWEGINFGTTRP